MDYYSPTTGSMGYGAGFQSWAILGTVALSESVPANAVENLKAMQQPDGGWEWMPNFLSDSNSTALAIQALIAAGESATSSDVISGLTYLKSIQNTDGGFPYTPGVDPKSDGNSTAYAIQAILAAGQNPITGTWKISDTNPVSFLLSLRLPDGSFKWQTEQTAANQLVTQQAVVALLGRPFPIRKAARGPACNAVYLPLTLSKTP
jgi:prenyltransferase beta subunit